jgi:hypothetical protein
MPRFLLLLVLALPAGALAQEAAPRTDAPAPSLALETDAGRPFYRFATYIDPVALFLDGYGLSVVACPSRFLSVTVSPFGAKKDGGTLGLELGLHARPFGRGVHGLALGGGGGALLMRGEDASAFRVFAEAGYTNVLGGLFLGGSVGVDVRFEDGSRDVGARVRVALGFAFH